MSTPSTSSLSVIIILLAQVIVNVDALPLPLRTKITCIFLFIKRLFARIFCFSSHPIFNYIYQTQATASNLTLDNEKIAKGRDILLRHPVKSIVYLFYWQVVSLFDCINPVQETGKEKNTVSIIASTNSALYTLVPTMFIKHFVSYR